MTLNQALPSVLELVAAGTAQQSRGIQPEFSSHKVILEECFDL